MRVLLYAEGDHIDMEEVRLNKYLAQCGVCSRRDADKLISEGKVTVGGRTADMGMKVTAADEIMVNGKRLHGREETVVLAYYKPVGVICTEKDKYAERIVTKEIGYPVRVTYAGRLDKDSEGLLLLSNDGGLIQRMMKGSAGHEKEYIVKTKQEITGQFLKQMAAGVDLHELKRRTRPCRVQAKGKYTFSIILTEGMNRQIRRMCKELSFDVVSLKRVRVMNIMLDGLKPGEYRIVEGNEKAALYRAAEMIKTQDGGLIERTARGGEREVKEETVRNGAGKIKMRQQEQKGKMQKGKTRKWKTQK